MTRQEQRSKEGNMKAVTFKHKSLWLTDKSRPVVEQDQVLIKVVMAGICSTDVELFEGYYDFSGVPGHEFVGIVHESPGDPRLEGKRVVSEINCGCGNCRWCKLAKQRHCAARKVIGIKDWDGAFAEYVRVPLENVHLVDESISSAAAVFVEPLAAALQASQQVHLRAADRIAVLGDGKLGLLTAIALRHFNPDLILIGKHQDKLAVAADQGVKTYRRAIFGSPAEQREVLGFFDIVVEATGKAEGISDALELIRPEGTIVAKSTLHKPFPIHMARMVVNEIHLVGSRCGDFNLALAFLRNQLVNVLPLIEKVYDFTDFKAAFEHARLAGSRKILLRY